MRRANKLTDIFLHIDMSGGKDACWPWKRALSAKGRPYYTINGKKELAYRVVYDLVNDEPLGDRMFRHSCDNPACCNPSHGIPGTHEENMTDMKERERHGLSHHMVRAIKKMLKNSQLTHQQIADLCGVSRVVITEINSGANYAHVKDEESENE